MNTKTTLFFLMSLCCIKGYAQSPWTNYTNDRFINDVLIVNNNVWVGSQGGLTRTHLITGDFQTYLPCNSPIMGGGILEIEKAPDNSLWLVSENAGVFHVKNGVWTNYFDGIISESWHRIENLQTLPNGDVWFFADLREDPSLNKLVRIRNGEVKSFRNLPEDVLSFAFLNEQSIFISNGNNIHRYDASLEQVVEVFNPGNSIITPVEEFWEIITDKNGSIILPSQDRILQLKNGTISVLSTPGVTAHKAFKDGVGNVYFQPPTGGPNAIRLVKYNGITVTYFKDEDFEPYPASYNAPLFRGADGEGKLYAYIPNDESEYSLFRFYENSWTPIKTQIFPMMDNYQSDVQSDCEGNLWFASRNGVDVRYADGTWEHFAVEVSQFTYFAPGQMTVDPVTCDVWFANNSNGGSPTIPGIIRISNGTVTHFLPGHANVSDIEATIDGKVYFFSGLHGFGYIENDEVHYIDTLGELQSVQSIDSDSKGHLYIAEWGPALIKYDGVNVTYLGEGELGEPIYYVYVDNDDLVWVVYSGGVKQFDGVQWIDYNEVWPESFSGIVQDRKGNYWVSTFLDGLYYWDKQTLQHYDIFNSDLTDNTLYSVALDPDGNLIVTQNIGASVLNIPATTDLYRGTGTVFFDYEKNGLFDQAKDILVPGQKIRDTDRNVWAVTNTYGKYSFYADTPAVYSYLHELETIAESTTDNPQSAEFVDYHSIFPDFGFWKPNVPDVKVTIVNGVPVCNRDFRVQILLRNKSPYTALGNFNLLFSDQLSVKNSSIPVTHETTGAIIFEDLSIEPFDILDIKLDFTAPGLTMDSLGTVLFFEGIFNTSNQPFVGTSLDSVVCSYDPNDKKVEPTGEFFNDYSLIKDPLKYTIRFQNEGTYKAFDITIIDTLDQHLNPSTFELLASSHDVETIVTAEGIVTFIFRNIDLPTRSEDELSSQGFVSFTVSPDSTLAGLERIFNNASIYFDFNPSIVTNTTQWNIVDDLATVSTEEVYADISIYPNPTEGMLSITIDKKADFYIWDGAGRYIDTGSLQPGDNTIQLDIPSGIYYLQVRNGDEIYAPVKVAVLR